MKRGLSGTIAYLPKRIADAICALSADTLCRVQEIRLRANKPLSLTVSGKNFFLCENGTLSSYPINALGTSAGELERVFLELCDRSVYVHETELKKGFISLKTGGRAGVCGSAVYDGAGALCGFNNITSLNIRVPCEVKGVAEPLMDYILGSNALNSMLIISPPNMGKTTILRDIARLASANGHRVCVIDERGEICGVAQSDIGNLTDALVGIDKVSGMEHAIRALSPELLICDEIASSEEANRLMYAINSGVAVVATCHAESEKMLMAKGAFADLITGGAIKYIATLTGLGIIGKVTEIQ